MGHLESILKNVQTMIRYGVQEPLILEIAELPDAFMLYYSDSKGTGLTASYSLENGCETFRLKEQAFIYEKLRVKSENLVSAVCSAASILEHCGYRVRVLVPATLQSYIKPASLHQ